MKPNAVWRRYAADVIGMIQQKDAEQVHAIRGRMADITTYVNGMIGDLHKRGRIALTPLYDYDKITRTLRGDMSKLQTFVNRQYDTMATQVVGFQKQVFNAYDRRFRVAIKEFGVKTKVAEESLSNMRVGFGGTPSKRFTDGIKRQLAAGYEPATMIKTVSQQNVQLIQRQLLTTVAKGKSFGWGTEKVIDELYPGGIARGVERTMEYNVTRIMRTSYMQVVNGDVTNFVKGNTDMFYGSRRVADGDPCIICAALDGEFIEPGGELDDHPNGQCLLVPLMYPDEYFETGTITEFPDDGWGSTMAEDFYAGTEAERESLFDNGKLYNLWQAERFDIRQLPVALFDAPLSGRQAQLNIERLGGISYPQVDFASTETKEAMNFIMDPRDRLADGKVVVAIDEMPTKAGLEFLSSLGKYGVDPLGKGEEYLGLTSVPVNVKARILAQWNVNEKLPKNWLQFNDRARRLGVFTRYDTRGRKYYLIDKKAYERSLKK